LIERCGKTTTARYEAEPIVEPASPSRQIFLLRQAHAVVAQIDLRDFDRSVDA